MTGVIEKITIQRTDLASIYNKGSGHYCRVRTESDVIHHNDDNKIMLKILVNAIQNEKGVCENESD